MTRNIRASKAFSLSYAIRSPAYSLIQMRKDFFHIRMRTGNDVDRNDFADDFRRSRTGIDGSLDGTDVTRGP